MVIHQERKAEYERHAARLLELDRQELEILSEPERKQKGDVPLGFDKYRYKIYWDGGSVKLGRMQCRIVKALYEAPKRRMLVDDLVCRVWNGTVLDGAVSQMFSRLRKVLLAANFPYWIESVKHTKEVVVYDAFTQGKAKIDHVGLIKGYKMVRRTAD
jgi:DNA-binding response OmpR family regulator